MKTAGRLQVLTRPDYRNCLLKDSSIDARAWYNFPNLNTRPQLLCHANGKKIPGPVTTYHLNLKPTGWLLFKCDLPEIIRDYRYNTRDEAIHLAEKFLLTLQQPVMLRIRDKPGVPIEERTLNAPQLD